MLESPMEILELKDGETYSFHIDSFQVDQGIIRPPHAPQGKAIRILRVHVPRGDKKMFPWYWDITGAGAIAQILPLLDSGAYKNRLFKLTAAGDGPQKRYAVEVV